MCRGVAECPQPRSIFSSYGALAAYVTDHALGVEGPIREFYLVGPHETADEDQWRTEIGWPIFRTGHARGPGKGSPV